ncbi:MAG: hypothetical protein NVSMB6_24090 [Burkholderiaceae bacterium]
MLTTVKQRHTDAMKILRHKRTPRMINTILDFNDDARTRLRIASDNVVRSRVPKHLGFDYF